MNKRSDMERPAHLVLALSLTLTFACNVGGNRGPETLFDNVTPVSSCAPCTLLENDGMCFSTEFQAAKDAAADPKYGKNLAKFDAGCPQGEMCVLCNNPDTGEPTGACGLAPLACPNNSDFTRSSCDAPIAYTDVNTLDSCGPDSVCTPYAYIDDEQLVKRVDPCPQDPSKACVPKFVIETAGYFTLTACRGLAGGEGRCLSTAFPEVAAGAEFLPQDVCAPDERCRNCFDPYTGEDTGVCSMGGDSASGSCDTGGNAAQITLYPNCEGTQGRCVHRDRMSTDSQESFRQRGCAQNHLCVGREIIADEYVLCVGDNPRDGNYLGTCLNTDIMVVDQSDRLDDEGFCRSQLGNGFRCVPCWQNAVPTNAPGCPDDPSAYVPDRLID